MTKLRLTFVWLVLAVLLVGALLVAQSRSNDTSTPASRLVAIASEVRCPTCEGLSVAESDAKAAKAVKAEIARRIGAGESDSEIKAFLASRYGNDILLRPGSTPWSWLVWALPPAIAIAIGTALVLTLRRWRSRTLLIASQDDDALVSEALSHHAR